MAAVAPHRAEPGSRWTSSRVPARRPTRPRRPPARRRRSCPHRWPSRRIDRRAAPRRRAAGCRTGCAPAPERRPGPRSPARRSTARRPNHRGPGSRAIAAGARHVRRGPAFATRPAARAPRSTSARLAGAPATSAAAAPGWWRRRCPGHPAMRSRRPAQRVCRLQGAAGSGPTPRPESAAARLMAVPRAWNYWAGLKCFRNNCCTRRAA